MMKVTHIYATTGAERELTIKSACWGDAARESIVADTVESGSVVLDRRNYTKVWDEIVASGFPIGPEVEIVDPPDNKKVLIASARDKAAGGDLAGALNDALEALAI